MPNAEKEEDRKAKGVRAPEQKGFGPLAPHDLRFCGIQFAIRNREFAIP
jgi:hypothetical protein